MEGLIVGLGSVAVALGIERLFLQKHSTRLKVKEQAFQFHALRDELQLLVADGRISTSSGAYDLLMTMLNFAIRNAGVVRLREILEVAEKIRNKMGNTQFISFDVEIKREDIEVQHLAQKFFETFASVLVSNDWIVRCAVKTLSAIRISWTAAKPVLEATNTVVTAILSHIAPMRLRAVRQARWYSERADSLKECTQY